MEKFAYVRCSFKGQNEARQVERFKEISLDDSHIFVEKACGKDFDRPVYQGMKNDTLHKGDVLYVVSLDCLGRNYGELAREWEDLTRRIGVDIVVLDMEILDTRKRNDLSGTLIADLVFKLLSYVAETEREKIRARQREGIEIAKREGKYKGRKPVEMPERFKELYSQAKAGKYTHNWVMQELGLKRTTYYKLVKQIDKGTI